MISPEIRMGVGTWAWGDRIVWKYGGNYNETDLMNAFRRAVHDNIRFFSTSESFAEGFTETLLGRFSAETTVPLFLSTKYTPRPWRIRRHSFLSALKASLLRLNRTNIDLYQIMPPVGIVHLPQLAECAVEALELGLIRQIGVSNFSLDQISEFQESLGRFGFSISSLETPYNLLYRGIETNGVAKLCEELNITIIAQNPLAMGYLTGKYQPLNPSEGNRRRLMKPFSVSGLELLIRLMNSIGADNNGKNCAQVSLNWVIQKGAIPIPGMKTAVQAEEDCVSPYWALTNFQMNQLDELSSRLTEK